MPVKVDPTAVTVFKRWGPVDEQTGFQAHKFSSSNDVPSGTFTKPPSGGFFFVAKKDIAHVQHGFVATTFEAHQVP
jgi:hypothetical protein